MGERSDKQRKEWRGRRLRAGGLETGDVCCVRCRRGGKTDCTIGLYLSLMS